MDADGAGHWQQPFFLRRMRAIDRKISELYSKTFHRWSSVTRWSILGAMSSLIGAWFVTAMIFWGAVLPPDIWYRLAIAATIGPLLVAMPMFYLFSIRMRRLAIENLRLNRVANIDSLTGCLNRGAFTALTHQLLSDNKQMVGGALLVIDADNFKAINDIYGHDQGDVALTLIADSLRRVVRTGALVGRLGGEEFGVYLPGATRLSAFLVAERIRRGIRKTPFAPAGVPYVLSVSIGGASFVNPISFAELFRYADQGLYAAKKAGRNMVEVGAVPTSTQTKYRA